MIRAAKHDDIPRLIELGRLMHDTTSYALLGFDEDKVRTLLATLIGGAGVVFVSEHDGQIVGGFAGGIAEYWFSRDLNAFDYAVFVDPAKRNGMIAVRLVTVFCEWARQMGAKHIQLGITTGVHVEATAKLYRALGFEEIGPLFKKEIV